MIKVYIISGFLGSGKTTLIKKLLEDGKFNRVMLLENEFGEVGIDGNLFDEGLKVKEINSGCICCSLKGDLKAALDEIRSYDIDALVIEPSGVGKLSEIMDTVSEMDDMEIKGHICMVDAKKAVIYHKNYKEFFDDQVVAANSIILSRADLVSEEKLEGVVAMLKEMNEDATVVTTPYMELDNDYLMDIIEENVTCRNCMEMMDKDELEHHLHHHDEECECEHHHHKHHHHDEECDCHHEHHHDEDDEECECHHEHHHDEECECGHHHHHHHDHDADEVFENIGFETVKTYTEEEIRSILEKLKGDVIRAKGFVKGTDSWLYFDLAGDDIIIRNGQSKYTGLVTVIGSHLNEEYIKGLFRL